ncbi:hypothetical protein ACWEGQ_35710 [Streptomyces seoulensis]
MATPKHLWVDTTHDWSADADADHPDAERLPDGRPRRGMSVVAALGAWLVHTDRRADGAWTQRYAHGVPTGDLTPVAPDGTTGPRVHFRPDPLLVPQALPPAAWPRLDVRVEDRRA